MDDVKALDKDKKSPLDSTKIIDNEMKPPSTEKISNNAISKTITGGAVMRNLMPSNDDLNSTVTGSSEAVKVFIRVRPVSSTEEGQRVVVSSDKNKKIKIVTKPSSSTLKSNTVSAEFDAVYGPEASQLNIYKQVQSSINDVLHGYNW